MAFQAMVLAFHHLNFLPLFGADNSAPSLPENAVMDSTFGKDEGLEPFPMEHWLPIYKQRDAVSISK